MSLKRLTDEKLEELLKRIYKGEVPPALCNVISVSQYNLLVTAIDTLEKKGKDSSFVEAYKQCWGSRVEQDGDS